MSLLQFSKKVKYYSQALSDVQVVCRDLLLSHPLAFDARKYLDSRLSIESQENSLCGYFPDDENLTILTDKIDKHKLNKIGFIYPYHVQNGDHRVYIDKNVMSLHNIILPYYDYYGNMVSFVGRTILSEEQRKNLNIQKYKYLKGPFLDYDLQFKKSLHLFGLNKAKAEILKQGFVILVEGQIDCITCYEYGIYNVVALGGVSLSKYQYNLLRRLTNTIYLLLDNDLEGKKARSKIINKYTTTSFKEIILPEGYKDVDQYLRNSSKESFLNLL